MDIIELIGRILFVSIFLMSGVAHFRQREQYVAYSRGSGAPLPQLMVPLTGLMLLAGGALILLGVWADLGALLIAAFLLPAAYFMHAFWKFEGQERAGEQGVFLKDLALGGAALALIALSHDGLAHAVSGPLF